MELLTLQEVLGTIKPGEEYVPTGAFRKIESIVMNEQGNIVIDYTGVYLDGTIVLTSNQIFKKKEDLVRTKIAKVEYFPYSMPVEVLVVDDTAEYDMIKFRKNGEKARYGMVLEVNEVMLKREDFKDMYCKVDNKVEEDNEMVTCYVSMVEVREGADPFEVLNTTTLPVGSICECFSSCGESASYVRIVSTSVKQVERKVYKAMCYV